jgi:hypothetical protein
MPEQRRCDRRTDERREDEDDDEDPARDRHPVAAKADPDLLPVTARPDLPDRIELADLTMRLDGDTRCQPSASRDELRTFGCGHPRAGSYSNVKKMSLALQKVRPRTDEGFRNLRTRPPQPGGFPTGEVWLAVAGEGHATGRLGPCIALTATRSISTREPGRAGARCCGRSWRAGPGAELSTALVRRERFAAGRPVRTCETLPTWLGRGG